MRDMPTSRPSHAPQGPHWHSRDACERRGVQRSHVREAGCIILSGVREVVGEQRLRGAYNESEIKGVQRWNGVSFY